MVSLGLFTVDFDSANVGARALFLGLLEAPYVVGVGVRWLVRKPVSAPKQQRVDLPFGVSQSHHKRPFGYGP